MMDASANLVEVPDTRERLRSYARALDVELDEHEINALLTGASSLADGLERLRKQLAAGFHGDFLAFRLWQGLAASPANFRQPAMQRRPFPSAQLGHIALRDTD